MAIGTTMVEPERTDTGGDKDDFVHFYCCDPDLSMCGYELTRDVDEGDDGEMCIVCEDLEFEPCADPNCPDRYDS